jgi:hypothetical protein
VDCWMEIQHGKGPWASPVSGIVPLGTTLTMVVGINDKQGELLASSVSGIVPLGTTLTMVVGINDKQGDLLASLVSGIVPLGTTHHGGRHQR